MNVPDRGAQRGDIVIIYVDRIRLLFTRVIEELIVETSAS